MKKFLLALSLILFIGVISGCAKTVPMDQLGKNGLFNYTNSYLHFNLSLPADFIYYQTQRVSSDNYDDLQILVPTADTSYTPQIIPNYANPVTIRVYDKNYWYKKMDDSQRSALNKIAEKGSRVYVMNFWDAIPSDWANKWNDSLKQELIKNFSAK